MMKKTLIVGDSEAAVFEHGQCCLRGRGIELEVVSRPGATLEDIPEMVDSSMQVDHDNILCFGITCSAWTPKSLIEGVEEPKLVFPNPCFYIEDVCQQMDRIVNHCKIINPQCEVNLVIPFVKDIYQYNLSRLQNTPYESIELINHPELGQKVINNYARSLHRQLKKLVEPQYQWQEKSILMSQHVLTRQKPMKGSGHPHAMYMKGRIHVLYSPFIKNGLYPTPAFVDEFIRCYPVLRNPSLVHEKSKARHQSSRTPAPYSAKHKRPRNLRLIKTSTNDASATGPESSISAGAWKSPKEEVPGKDWDVESGKHEMNEQGDDDFVWENERILMVGDFRAGDMEYHAPEVVLSFWRPEATLSDIIEMVDQNLDSKPTVLILLAFHCDMCSIELNRLIITHANVDALTHQAKEATEKWKRRLPNLCVIWTTPYTPNFVLYNKKNFRRSKFAVREDKEAVLHFYFMANKLLHNLRAVLHEQPYDLQRLIFYRRGLIKAELLVSKKSVFSEGKTIRGLRPNSFTVKFFWSRIKRHIRYVKTLNEQQQTPSSSPNSANASSSQGCVDSRTPVVQALDSFSYEDMNSSVMFPQVTPAVSKNICTVEQAERHDESQMNEPADFQAAGTRAAELVELSIENDIVTLEQAKRQDESQINEHADFQTAGTRGVEVVELSIENDIVLDKLLLRRILN